MRPHQTVVLVMTLDPETSHYDRGLLASMVADLVRDIPCKLAQDIRVYETPSTELVDRFHKELLNE